jgi:dTDP-4-amino-4,6-dideoxygalactose transaminase
MDKLALHGGPKVRDRPFAKHNRYGEAELQELREALEQGTLFYWHGSKVKKFQSTLADMLGLRHCTATTSGTASIHTALGAIGLGVGDEVITSPITDIGTVVGILYQNAIPVFADLHPRTYAMEPASIEACITERTKAILVVHLGGSPANMDAILDVAKRHQLYVIEDCAQAWMASYQGRFVGTMGDLGAFSLNEFKHISCGDGGAVVTDDDALGAKARMFADKYMDRVAGVRESPMLAPNYRMTELQGAVALAQLSKVHDVCQRRTSIGDRISREIEPLAGVLAPQTVAGGKHVYWHYMLRIDAPALGASREHFAEALNAEGIPCTAGYIPTCIYEYPLFKNRTAYPNSSYPFELAASDKSYHYHQGLCPQAEEILASCVVLPCSEFYTDDDVSDIINAITKVARHFHTQPALVHAS